MHLYNLELKYNLNYIYAYVQMMCIINKKNKIYYNTYSLSTTTSSDTLPHTHIENQNHFCPTLQ